MRLLVKLKCLVNSKYDNDHVYYLSSYLYKLLKHTNYSFMHDLNIRKPYVISNVFPVSDFIIGQDKNFIISSIDNTLIKHFQDCILKNNLIDLDGIRLVVVDIKPIKVDIKPGDIIETGTPIVLKYENKYFGYKNNINAVEFLDKLSRTMLKKYNNFNNKSITEFDLQKCFSKFEFYKTTAVTLNIKGNKSTIIGTKWRFKVSKYINKEQLQILQFNFDCGFGQKTAMGFGCMNKVLGKRSFKYDYKRLSRSGKTHS